MTSELTNEVQFKKKLNKKKTFLSLSEPVGKPSIYLGFNLFLQIFPVITPRFFPFLKFLRVSFWVCIEHFLQITRCNKFGIRRVGRTGLSGENWFEWGKCDQKQGPINII
jgi:hypothetical protein